MQQGHHQAPSLCLQEQPSREVAPGYLGSLSTTGAMFSALRKAHAAKLAIHSGSVPTAHDIMAVAGPAQAVPGYVWEEARCERASFSPCGKWLTVSFAGKLLDDIVVQEGNAEAGSEHTLAYGLVLYKASASFSEIYRYWSCQLPVFCWASSAPHLSITCRCFPPGCKLCPRHGTFVMDCQTLSIQHQLSSGTEQVLQKLWQQCQHSAWCSNARKLLIFSSSGHLKHSRGVPGGHRCVDRLCAGAIFTEGVQAGHRHACCSLAPQASSHIAIMGLQTA